MCALLPPLNVGMVSAELAEGVPTHPGSLVGAGAAMTLGCKVGEQGADGHFDFFSLASAARPIAVITVRSDSG